MLFVRQNNTGDAVKKLAKTNKFLAQKVSSISMVGQLIGLVYLITGIVFLFTEGMYFAFALMLYVLVFRFGVQFILQVLKKKYNETHLRIDSVFALLLLIKLITLL